MVTPTQLQNLIKITIPLREKEMSIAELRRRMGMKRSTLNYYLNILEEKGYLTRERIEEKQTGRPTLLKFNEEKYKQDQDKWEKDFQKQEEEMLNNPLTSKLLNFLRINKNPSLAVVEKSLGNYVRVTGHLSWLIHKGLVVNEYKLTPEGLKFLEGHKGV